MPQPNDLGLKCAEWGVACAPMPGEREAGDAYLVTEVPCGMLVAVVDGLGHAAEAASAAQAAIAELRVAASDPLPSIFLRCHEALRRTRGAVISTARFDAAQNAMSWLGVGNVEGVLVAGDPRQGRPRQSLLLRGGVVGYKLPRLRPSTLPVKRGDTLVVATDGIRSSFAGRLDYAGTPEELARRTLDEYGTGNDDALVLVVRYLGGGT
jgi:negative regulator of sigma-B (phosphoserine phosphatase)